MMLGERPNTTVQIPPWTLFDDPTAGMLYSHHPSPLHLRHYLTPNEIMLLGDPDSDLPRLGSDVAVDEYSSDEFRMYEFKIRRCARGRSHDWTECPFAHPGEKAKRRDPRKFHYSGTACPDFRKGMCKRGDSCEYAHGVFECWLHPARYRTQPCKDGTGCRRRVCFFAHTPEQLRVVQQQQKSPRGAVGSYDGSPFRHASYKSSSIVTSPTSTLASGPFSSSPSDSPPVSPDGLSTRRALLSKTVNDVLAVSLGKLQLNKANSWGTGSPRAGGSDLGSAFGSLRSAATEPMGTKMAGMCWMDVWEDGAGMERVESGRNLRAKILEKLSRESSMEMNTGAPDVGWVSDLVK